MGYIIRFEYNLNKASERPRTKSVGDEIILKWIMANKAEVIQNDISIGCLCLKDSNKIPLKYNSSIIGDIKRIENNWVILISKDSFIWFTLLCNGKLANNDPLIKLTEIIDINEYIIIWVYVIFHLHEERSLW